MSFPDKYTLPYTTPHDNRVVGVYIEAKIPEKPHTHTGGRLVHIPTPIEVFVPSNQPGQPDLSIYKSDEIGKELVSVKLAPAGLHYSCTPNDYVAVFIEIRSQAIHFQKRLKMNLEESLGTYEDGCWEINQQLVNIDTGDRECFIVSKLALKIYQLVNEERFELEPIKDLPYPTYVLSHHQKYLVDQIVLGKFLLFEE